MIGAPVALVVWLALVPLVFLLWQSFLTPQPATLPAQYTLENFRTAYLSSDNARLFFNSLQFATGAAVLALVVGTGLAWMNERTNTPFKTLFFALAIIPLVIPGILFTVSWIMLASPKIGLVNLALQKLFDTDAVFVNVYTMAGMIWVAGLHYPPIGVLLAHGVSADDGGVPLHGPCARGASRHERGLGAANCATDHLAVGMAGGARIAADPIRAFDRIVRGAGAARPARGHPRVYLVDL